MQETVHTSFERARKAAPWLCLASIAIVTATLFVYSKLYVLAVLLGPPLGLLSFGSLLAYWRLNKAALSALMPAFFAGMSPAFSKGGLFWGVPQGLAIAIFFMAFPLVVLGKQIGRWLKRKHG